MGLGAILSFLLTGHAPTTALLSETAQAGEAAFLLSPPRRRKANVPRPLEAICLKALAPEQGERYTCARELADDVARFLAAERVAAYPEGFFGAGWRLATKYRTGLILVLAYLAMRILLLFFPRS